jgi:hypothetical protein
MPPPMIGNWSVEVKAVRPFTIHGDLYYELHVINPDNAQQLMALRVPQHAIEGVPTAGEKLTLTFLMGQVTQAKRELIE